MRKGILGAVAVGTAAAGAAGAAAMSTAAVRRWARAVDATGGNPLGLPDNDELRVPTRDGGELHARVMGDGGRLFVLGHGWTSDHRVWAPVARRLVANGHRVVTYDQRGHGTSRAGDAGLAMVALGADLADLLEALDAFDAIVAGHSMGGMAVQHLALDHPHVVRERVHAIALVSTACNQTAIGPLASLVGRAVGSEHLNRLVGNARLAPFVFRSAVGKDACLIHITATGEAFAATPAATRGQLYADMAAMDLSARLEALDIPITIVCGTRDMVLPLPRSRHLARLLPHARFEIVPGAGHMLMCEHPDLVTELLEDAAKAQHAGDQESLELLNDAP